MAVKVTLFKTALTLKYMDEIDAAGKDIIKAKKFSNVKINADDQSIFDTATAFTPLMEYPITETLRSNDSSLNNA